MKLSIYHKALLARQIVGPDMPLLMKYSDSEYCGQCAMIAGGVYSEKRSVGHRRMILCARGDFILSVRWRSIRRSPQGSRPG
jgi:hypothetical protein